MLLVNRHSPGQGCNPGSDFTVMTSCVNCFGPSPSWAIKMAMLEQDIVLKYYNISLLLRLDSHLRNPGALDPSSRHKPLNLTLRPLQLKTGATTHADLCPCSLTRVLGLQVTLSWGLQSSPNPNEHWSHVCKFSWRFTGALHRGRTL